MAKQISSLNYDDSTTAGRKIVQLIQALEEVSFLCFLLIVLPTIHFSHIKRKVSIVKEK
jgi:hypothetical protein